MLPTCPVAAERSAPALILFQLYSLCLGVGPAVQNKLHNEGGDKKAAEIGANAVPCPARRKQPVKDAVLFIVCDAYGERM
jgi:hypothetical protein